MEKKKVKAVKSRLFGKRASSFSMTKEKSKDEMPVIQRAKSQIQPLTISFMDDLSPGLHKSMIGNQSLKSPGFVSSPKYDLTTPIAKKYAAPFGKDLELLFNRNTGNQLPHRFEAST